SCRKLVFYDPFEGKYYDQYSRFRRQSRHSGTAATADPSQSSEACQQAKRAVNSGTFGKKLPTPATFQVKHRLLIWWLRRQMAKEAPDAGADAGADADAEALKSRGTPRPASDADL